MSTAPRIRRARAWAIAAGVAIAAMVGTLVAVGNAEADIAGLSGVVHGPTGAPLAGVTVKEVYVYVDHTNVIQTTKSSSTGAFSFPQVASAMSTLEFGATATTFDQFLGGTSAIDGYERDSTGLDSALDKNYIVATLAASGTISGKVSKLPSGVVSGFTVRAYRQLTDGSWAVQGSAKTSSTGAYSITGLEPAAYHLQAIDLTSAHPAYAPVYSGGSNDIASALDVGVVASKTSSYNFTVGKAGSVSGTVTGQKTLTSTENLGNVHVTPYRLVGTPGSFTSAVALDSPSTTTSSTGAYSLTGLTAGYYTLDFNPPGAAPYSPSGTQYGRTFLGGQTDPTQAVYFQIGNGNSVTGQNITLVGTATITGTVFDSTAPADTIPNIRVEVDYAGRDADLPSEHAQIVHTAADGTFRVSDLGPGTYELYVGSNASTDSNYIAENTQGSWQRQIVNVPGPLAAGSTTDVPVYLDPWGTFGMYSTTNPQINTTTAIVGDTVSVDNGTWNTSDIQSYTYQWFVEGTPIQGATQSSYTLRPFDVNQHVICDVTAHSFAFGAVTEDSSNGINVGFGTLTQTSPGSITGTLAMGQTLTANAGDWSPSGTYNTFRWETSDGTTWNTNVGSGPTLTLTPNLWTSPLSVRLAIDSSKRGYQAVETEVDASGTVAMSPIQLVTSPVVKKTSAGFSLSGGTWSPSYFQQDNIEWTITKPDATFTTYDHPVLPLATAGNNSVTVTEQHTEAGFTPFTTNPILAQRGPAPVATGTNVLTGTPQVAVPLSAPSPTWLPVAGTSTWQWQYESGTTWRSIGGATASTYNPTSSYLGKLLRVVTTRVTPGFNTATLVTTAKTKVVAGVAPMIVSYGNGFFHGTGDVASVAPTWLPTPTSLGYQWEYSASASGPWTKISGATKSSYLIPQSLLGKYLQVIDTAALSGHTSGSAVDSIGQVGKDQLTLTSTPKVTSVNGVYTISNVTFSPAVPANQIQYKWYVYNADDASPSVQSTSLGTPSFNVGTSSAPFSHWAATISVPGYNGYTYTESAPNILVKKGSLGVTAPITLGGSQVGKPITPSTISWVFNNPTLKYQWQYESGTTWHSIASSSGGTGATFTPSATYLNHNVRVVVTASKTNYNSASTTSATTLVGLGDAPVAGTGSDAAQLNGYGIGATWTALPGTWSIPGLAYHYQWAFSSSASGPWTNITGATSASYSAPDGLLHDYLQATITATKTGYAMGTTTAVSSQLQDGLFRLLTAPKVTLANGTYTVTNNGVWSPAATSYEYDWELFDPATDSSSQVSTTNSYTPQLADAGKQIQLTIYPDKTGYNSLGTTFVVRQGMALAPTSAITLTGGAVVGNDLTINLPGWNVANPQVGVTWYRNGVATGTNINSLTYPLTAADLGKTISAKVTAIKDGYPSYSVSLTSTTTFSNFVIAATTDPSITNAVFAHDPGSQPVGTVLTTSVGAWNTTGLSYSYQWYRTGVAIPGATGSTYTLQSQDLGAEVSVKVTAGKTYYTPQSDTSQAVTVDVGVGPTNSVSNPFKITGTPQVGKVLTLTILGSWSVPATVTLQWEISNDGGSNWTYVWGAEGMSYTLSAADGVQAGTIVQVSVYADAPGYNGYGENSASITVQP